MDVLQLSSLGAASNALTSNASQKSSDAQGNGFNTVLGNLIEHLTADDAAGSPVSGKPTQLASLKSKLLELMNSTKGLPEGTGGAGENILTLAAMLLNAFQQGTDEQTILAGLATMVQQLNGDMNGSANSLLELLTQTQKSDAGDTIIDKLRTSLNGLPESIKLKLRNSDTGNVNEALSPEETGLVRNAIMTALVIQIPSTDSQSPGIFAGDRQTSGALSGDNGIRMEISDLTGQQFTTQDVVDPSGDEVAPAIESKLQPTSAEPVPASADGSSQSAGIEPKAGDLLARGGVIDVLDGVSDMKPGTAGVDTDRTGVFKMSATNSVTVVGTTDSKGTSTGDDNKQQPGWQASPGSSSQAPAQALSTTSSGGSDAAQLPFVHLVNSSGSNQVDTSQTTAAQEVGVGQELVDPEKLMAGIVNKLDILLADGKSEAKIKLKPDYLGELKIHLVMDGGSMKAVLDVSTPMAKDLLEANLNTLKQALEGQGLKLKEFEVSVNQQNSNQSPSHNRQQRFQRRYGYSDNMSDVAVHEIAHIGMSSVFDGGKAVNCLA